MGRCKGEENVNSFVGTSVFFLTRAEQTYSHNKRDMYLEMMFIATYFSAPSPQMTHVTQSSSEQAKKKISAACYAASCVL